MGIVCGRRVRGVAGGVISCCCGCFPFFCCFVLFGFVLGYSFAFGIWVERVGTFVWSSTPEHQQKDDEAESENNESLTNIYMMEPTDQTRRHNHGRRDGMRWWVGLAKACLVATTIFTTFSLVYKGTGVKKKTLSLRVVHVRTLCFVASVLHCILACVYPTYRVRRCVCVCFQTPFWGVSRSQFSCFQEKSCGIWVKEGGRATEWREVEVG